MKFNKNATIGFFVGNLATLIVTGLATLLFELGTGSSIILAAGLGATLTGYISTYIQGRIK